MAEVLSLVQRDDFTVDIDSVSLLAYTDGFQSAYRGWKMQNTPEENGRVIETIKLRAKGTSIDNLAAKLQGLADKSWQTERYAPIDRYGVWLRAKLDGETNARQAFVYQLRHEQASSIFDQAMMAKYRINEYTLAVERSPYWEGTASQDFICGTLSASGGTLQYGTINGDVPARMALVSIDTSPSLIAEGTNAGGIWWIGFRSNRYGDCTKFQPYWDCVKGTAYYGGTALTASNSRSGTVLSFGTVALPADGSLHDLYRSWLVSVTANYNEQCGQFLAIMRANPQNGTFNLQLRYGMYPDNRYQTNPRVRVVGNTNRYMGNYVLGEVDIGSQAPYSVDGNVSVWRSFWLDVWGERNAGTENLYLDTIYLIPLEGFVCFGEPTKSSTLRANQTKYQAMQRANGVIEYAGSSSMWDDSLYTIGSVQMQGGIQPGPGVVVGVGEAGEESIVGLKCILTVKAIPRWKELRGAE